MPGLTAAFRAAGSIQDVIHGSDPLILGLMQATNPLFYGASTSIFSRARIRRRSLRARTHASCTESWRSGLPGAKRATTQPRLADQSCRPGWIMTGLLFKAAFYSAEPLMLPYGP